MKAIIGGAAGVVALGGALLLANTRSTTNSVQASNPAQTVASTSAGMQVPVAVDCGEGRQALIRPMAPGQAYSQVECAPAPVPVAQPYAANYLVPPGAYPVASGAYPVASGAYPAVQQVPVQERVVYRDRVVYQDRPVYRSSGVRRTSSARRASYSPYQTAEQRRVRSWKKSALIIGGSAAGGAGVGAILGGKSGAKKGAIVGGVGGLVYDLATRNK